MEVGTRLDGILDLNALRTIDVLHALDELIKVAFVAVKLVDEEDDRLVQLFGISEVVLCANLRAILAIDEYDGLVGDVEGRDGTPHKVVATRTIDNIELFAIPLCMEYGGEDRIAVLLLHREIVAYRILGFYGATTLDDTSFEKHTLGKCGLAATRTANQGNVFNLICLIYFHIG